MLFFVGSIFHGLKIQGRGFTSNFALICFASQIHQIKVFKRKMQIKSLYLGSFFLNDKFCSTQFDKFHIFWPKNGRIRAVSGPYQGRIRAVSGPYQGRIRAVSGLKTVNFQFFSFGDCFFDFSCSGCFCLLPFCSYVP